jgi:DNA (cytosine-5)-methyltransferase 1
MTLTVGSLFSGIGGLDLGLERAGMRIAWQVERDPGCQAVLAHHWPHVPRYGDVRTVGMPALSRVDLICGGFPCQDLSHAASGWDRPGLLGERSSLYAEFVRILWDLFPRWAIIENVAAPWRAWVPVVRRALWEHGYTSVPFRVYAEDVGAPFQGARIFVVATADGDSESALREHAEMAELSGIAGAGWTDWGEPSPAALGVVDGVPRRMDRLRECGNAVVPACAERIGRLILDCV